MKYYLDTEFDGFGGPLISIALVCEDGRSLYGIVRRTADDAWVDANVIPHLYSAPFQVIEYAPTTMTSLHNCLEAFFKGDGDIRVMADWPDDIKYLSECLITGPGTMIHIPSIEFSVRRVDAYPTRVPGAIQHNAWWDATALCHYMRFGAPEKAA